VQTKNTVQGVKTRFVLPQGTAPGAQHTEKKRHFPYDRTHALRGQEAEAVNMLPDFSRPSRENQKKTGTDDINATDSVLASCLAFSCAQHSPTTTSGETTNAPHDTVNGVFDRARQDSNLQPSDSKQILRICKYL